MTLTDKIGAILSHKSKGKVLFDKYVDPILFRLGAYGVFGYSAERLHEYISDNIDDSLIKAGIYAGVASSLVLSETCIIGPIVRKIKKTKDWQYQEGRPVKTLKSMIKSCTALAALVTLFWYQGIEGPVSKKSEQLLNPVQNTMQVMDKSNYKESSSPSQIPDESIKTSPEEKKKHDIFMAFADYQSEDGKVALGPLEGIAWGGLPFSYTQISGEYPAFAMIDWKKNLDKMWQQKIRLSNNPAVDETYQKQIRPSFDREWKTSNLEDYLTRVEQIITDTREDIDWQKVQDIYRLDDDQLQILYEVAHALDAKDMLSYSMTELMPNAGPKALMMYEFILRHAGERFLASVPAMGDKLVSFGMYQFTKYAIDVGQRKVNVAEEREPTKYEIVIEKNGASIMNDALPKNKKIPDKVGLIEGDDHHKAAYIFMLNNMAHALNSLKKHDIIDTFRENWKSHKSELIQFFAGSHYRTTVARENFTNWVDHGMRSQFKKSCSESILHYVRKTEKNYAVLHDDSYETFIAQRLEDIKPKPAFAVIDELPEEGAVVIKVSKEAIRQYVNPANIIRALDAYDRDFLANQLEDLTPGLWTQKTYERLRTADGSYVGDKVNPDDGPFYIRVKQHPKVAQK
jgi:hypothetical protein